MQEKMGSVKQRNETSEQKSKENARNRKHCHRNESLGGTH